jgi:hypothetical protein
MSEPREPHILTTDDTCPYCEKHIDDIYEHFGRQQEDAFFDCPHCEKPLCATLDIRYLLRPIKHEEPVETEER